MATDDVYKFMKEHNRPFSANDVLQSIGKDHGKTAVQKALDKLVDQGKIFEKIYGKQKVYCVTQELDDGANLVEDTKKLDREINELALNLKETEEKLNRNLVELKSVENKMSLEQAKSASEVLEEEVKTLKEKLECLKENAEPISEEYKEKVCKEYEKYNKEYRKRKRLCKDMLDAILEGYPKSKKHLLEETGIETDEDVNFKYEEMKI